MERQWQGFYHYYYYSANAKILHPQVFRLIRSIDIDGNEDGSDANGVCIYLSSMAAQNNVYHTYIAGEE